MTLLELGPKERGFWALMDELAPLRRVGGILTVERAFLDRECGMCAVCTVIIKWDMSI